MRLKVGISLGAVVAAALVSGASAKDFKPGDLRVCAVGRCLALRDQRALDAVGSFYYGGRKPAPATAPARRAPYVELRFRNGYVTGVAAGRRFDRFLSFGVNGNQFDAGVWYRVPPLAAVEFRRLAAKLSPRPLPADILQRSH